MNYKIRNPSRALLQTLNPKPEALCQEMPTAMKQIKKALAKLQSQSNWDAGLPLKAQKPGDWGV